MSHFDSLCVKVPRGIDADLRLVYPKAGFTAWVCISLIWLFVGLAMVGIYPAWEARVGLKKVCAGRLLHSRSLLLTVD